MVGIYSSIIVQVACKNIIKLRQVYKKNIVRIRVDQIKIAILCVIVDLQRQFHILNVLRLIDLCNLSIQLYPCQRTINLKQYPIELCQTVYNISANMQKLMNMGHSHPNIAFLYAFVGYGFLAFQQILTKYATVSLSSFQLLSIRSFLLIWFSLWVVQSVKCSPYVPSSQFFGLILRRIAVVAIAQTLIFFCVTKIPISTVTTIFNTGPIFIFFVEALAYQKAIKRVNFILTIVSFTGVILIVQPDLIFGQNQRSVEGTGFYIGLMLLAALGSAINNHYIHKLAKNVHPYVNNFYSHMGHVVLNGIMNNLKPRSVPENFLTVNLVLIILGVSAATIVSQYGINLANSIKSPTLMMPFGYVGIVVGMCADVYLFGSQFDTLQCLGMFLTSCGLLSGYLVSFGSKEYSRL